MSFKHWTILIKPTCLPCWLFGEIVTCLSAFSSVSLNFKKFLIVLPDKTD